MPAAKRLRLRASPQEISLLRSSSAPGVRRRAHQRLVHRSTSNQQFAPHLLQVAHHFLLACHRNVLVALLLAVDPFHLRLARCRQVVVLSHLLQVVAFLLVAHVPVAELVSVLVLVHAPAVLVSVLVLVAHVPVALVHVLVVQVLAPAALVLVLVLVLVPEVPVAHAPVLLAVHLVLALTLVVHVLAAVLVAAPAVHVMVSVAHLARSHVHVVGASSTNCSRSSRATPTAMHRCQKAPSSSSVVGQHKSSLRSSTAPQQT